MCGACMFSCVWYMCGTLCSTCACVCVHVYGVLCVFICVSGACVVHVRGKLCGACMCVHVCMCVVHVYAGQRTTCGIILRCCQPSHGTRAHQVS